MMTDNFGSIKLISRKITGCKGNIFSSHMYINRLTEDSYTYRSSKMWVCIQGFVVSLVLDVPHSQRLVIRGTQDVLPSWVEYQSSHPVVVSRLQKRTSLKLFRYILWRKRTMWSYPSFMSKLFRKRKIGNFTPALFSGHSNEIHSI